MAEKQEIPEQLPRGRHGLPREAVELSQRQRILQGMVEVVAEKGYAETRIADVIKVAGVSRKTFYELFGDKEECFLAAYELWAERLFVTSLEAFNDEPTAPWTERIRKGLFEFLQLIAENPAPAKVCLVEVLGAGPKALARRDSAIRQFSEYLDLGRSESDVPLPGITALAVAGGINELLYTEILHGATAQLPARLPDLMYWVVQPYFGDERAAQERERARELLRG